jgi:hypothetical protein
MCGVYAIVRWIGRNRARGIPLCYGEQLDQLCFGLSLLQGALFCSKDSRWDRILLTVDNGDGEVYSVLLASTAMIASMKRTSGKLPSS